MYNSHILPVKVKIILLYQCIIGSFCSTTYLRFYLSMSIVFECISIYLSIYLSICESELRPDKDRHIDFINILRGSIIIKDELSLIIGDNYFIIIKQSIRHI